ncbi:hypothetical protein ABK040_006364 [Willaertia magna]
MPLNFSLKGIKQSDENCARIQTSSLGFEYSSKSTSQLNTFLVGPFINLNNLMMEKIKFRENNKELNNWLKQQKRVVLLILGTTMVLTKETMIKLLNGFKLTLQLHRDISFLIALQGINLQLFNEIVTTNNNELHSFINHPNFKIIKGFVPQKVLLSHKNVKIFISHSGANSINEALYFGKLIIGLPFSFDHFKYASSLDHFKVGIPLFFITRKGK